MGTVAPGTSHAPSPDLTWGQAGCSLIAAQTPGNCVDGRLDSRVIVVDRRACQYGVHMLVTSLIGGEAVVEL